MWVLHRDNAQLVVCAITEKFCLLMANALVLKAPLLKSLQVCTMQGLAELVTDDNITRLRKEVEASQKKKTPAATKEEEEKKDEEVEHMDDDDMLVTDKDKDAASGPSAGEGSGPPT